MNPNKILNGTILTQEENKYFGPDDPKMQYDKIQSAWTTKTDSKLNSHYINKKCIEIMKIKNKTPQDYTNFLIERDKEIRNQLQSRFSIPISNTNQEVEEDFTESD